MKKLYYNLILIGFLIFFLVHLRGGPDCLSAHWTAGNYDLIRGSHEGDIPGGIDQRSSLLFKSVSVRETTKKRRET